MLFFHSSEKLSPSFLLNNLIENKMHEIEVQPCLQLKKTPLRWLQNHILLRTAWMIKTKKLGQPNKLQTRVMPPARKHAVAHQVAMATVRSFFLAHMLFFTTRTAWHCESLQWYINLSLSANPSVFPKGFRDDCNWALSSAVGCAIDKWPNSPFCQRAYADIAPNISVMIKFLTMVQHCSLLIQKGALLIQLHSHYSLPKLRDFTGRETLVKSVGKKNHTPLWQLCWQTLQRSP